MGRKAQLINECKSVLSIQRKGSLITKRKYRTVMRSIIDDLIYLHCAPRSFCQLTKKQIQNLAHYWREQGNTPGYIAAKLSILRGYYKLAKIDLEIPSNKELKLIKCTKQMKSFVLDEEIIGKVYHPLTKSIIAFQIEFGLTKSESIKLKLNEFTIKDNLTIYRDIAYNHKDRIIPITSQSQRQTIAARLQLLDEKGALIELAPFNIICGLYKAELDLIGVTQTDIFRKGYAQKRFSLLKKINKAVAYQELRAELGFSSIYILKKWLHE